MHEILTKQFQAVELLHRQGNLKKKRFVVQESSILVYKMKEKQQLSIKCVGIVNFKVLKVG